ncbi:MAG: cyclase family protein [Gemmatimonadaceae bacterium]
MRLRDISITLAGGTPEWPGDTPYACGWTATLSQGSSVNVSSYTTSPHVGTHADAPLHVRDGWQGSHELPLEAFFGRATVVDVSSAEHEIEIGTIDAAVGDSTVERILLKTGSTIASGTFPESWPTLSEACARELLGRGLRLIGVDAPSVDDRHSKSLPVHKMIFAGNACILENLDLRRIPPGRYELIAFPLKIMSLDAAPVRAILRDLA